MVKNLSSYEWSSYPAYLNLVENHHLFPRKTLSYFQEPLTLNYKNFVENPIKKEQELLK